MDVTFQAYVHNLQESRQLIQSNKKINFDEQEVAPGKQNVRAACPKDKMESRFFSRSSVVQQAISLENEELISHSVNSVYSNLNCNVTKTFLFGLRSVTKLWFINQKVKSD